MELIKSKKHKVKLSSLMILGSIGYAVFALINQQIQIDKRKKQLDEILEKIQIQEVKNDQLRLIADCDDDKCKEYAEKVARSDLDLSKRGERVFVNICGE